MSTVIVDAVSDGVTTKTIDDLLTPPSGAGALTAWANYNGTGTAAVNDSDNVASITDNGTGNYTFTFTNSMSVGSYGIGAFAGDAGLDLYTTGLNGYMLVGEYRVAIRDDANTFTDPDIGSFVQYGDLA